MSISTVHRGFLLGQKGLPRLCNDDKGDSSILSSVATTTAAAAAAATTSSTTTTRTSHPWTILACSVSKSPSDEMSETFSTGFPTSIEEFQTQLLAATGSSSIDTDDAKQQKTPRRDELADGPLCEYRRGFLDHLKPHALARSTLKLAMQQGIVILTGFMSEQLEGDLKRNELVSEGKLTKREAEEEAEVWEKVEWEKRWKTFPQKFLVALSKYHAVTLVLRTYEYIASLCCTTETLDKLTMDYYAASKTMSRKVDVKNEKAHCFARMTDCTFWANLLYYLADYSVCQACFCYAYYVYYQRQKKQQKLLTKDDEMEVAKSLAVTSGHLMASRSLGLLFSAFGGGIGMIVWPGGWGTLMLSAMAESAGVTLVDDGHGTAMSKLTGEDDPSTKKKKD
ncbi:hypothetical protein IV203_017892 [Nitzschia inconspicua]|uniref:Uncharacterized protein n=1 Tax=Nitzschia inconspicua TaxID=303405 RepID=A0A9K3M0E2_9STRA|nr:hypothetical protein IV203_017892 [Nitzschia inconspicua]